MRWRTWNPIRECAGSTDQCWIAIDSQPVQPGRQVRCVAERPLATLRPPDFRQAAGQVLCPGPYRHRTLLDADHDPSAGKLRLEAKPFQEIERDFQPVGLLGVDVEPDVVLARQHGQRLEARIELGVHSFQLGAAVARMQRGELDRDARPFVDAAALGGAADGMDRPPIGLHVMISLRRRDGGLAQHVVGMAEALLFERAAVRQRLVDGLAGDELLAPAAAKGGGVSAGAGLF